MRLGRPIVLVSLLAAATRPTGAQARPQVRAQAPAGRPEPAPTPAAPTAPLDPARRRALLAAPADPFWSTRAPDTVVVDLATTRGPITVVLRRAWAPRGVDRVYQLARAGYFDDSRVYRVVDGYIAQFGLAGDPAVAGRWSRQTLPPDPRRASNARGTVSFAQSAPDDRTTTLFINLRDNPHLDTLGFVPVGRVVTGMAAADRLYAGYGERPIAKAHWTRVARESNAFLDAEYPKLDRIRAATVRAP